MIIVLAIVNYLATWFGVILCCGPGGWGACEDVPSKTRMACMSGTADAAHKGLRCNIDLVHLNHFLSDITYLSSLRMQFEIWTCLYIIIYLPLVPKPLLVLILRTAIPGELGGARFRTRNRRQPRPTAGGSASQDVQAGCLVANRCGRRHSGSMWWWVV